MSFVGDDPLDELPEPMPDAREPTKLIGIDDRGNRVGEDHPRAKLSDEDVELIRQLWEERGEHPISLKQIANKFEVAKSTIHDIVTFKRRATYPTGWRRVKLSAGAAKAINKHVKGGLPL